MAPSARTHSSPLECWLSPASLLVNTPWPNPVEKNSQIWKTKKQKWQECTTQIPRVWIWPFYCFNSKIWQKFLRNSRLFESRGLEVHRSKSGSLSDSGMWWGWIMVSKEVERYRNSTWLMQQPLSTKLGEGPGTTQPGGGSPWLKASVSLVWGTTLAWVNEANPNGLQTFHMPL